MMGLVTLRIPRAGSTRIEPLRAGSTRMELPRAGSTPRVGSTISCLAFRLRESCLLLSHLF